MDTVTAHPVTSTAHAVSAASAGKEVREGGAALAAKDVKVELEKEKDAPLSPSGMLDLASVN
jgi:hypothetical protein